MLRAIETIQDPRHSTEKIGGVTLPQTNRLDLLLIVLSRGSLIIVVGDRLAIDIV